MDVFVKAMIGMVLCVVALAIAAMVTVGIIDTVKEWNEPYCPTEDSCSAEYNSDDDKWHIVEIVS